MNKPQINIEQQLSTAERQELKRCEMVIYQGLETFLEVGQALMMIRDKRLYRLEYKTFEGYCRDKWGMSKTTANRLVSASQVITNLTPMGVKPSTERQTRPLTSLSPPIQREAWKEVVETHGENITAKKVEEVAARWKPIDEQVRQAESEPIFSQSPEQIIEEAKNNRPHVANNSGNNEWYTPSRYIEAARQVMGEIDLDPASSEIANQWVKAKTYFDEQTNGLDKKWFGRVWMNPPYAQPLINDFSQKLTDEVKNGNVQEAIVLTNNATETNWGGRLLANADAVCFNKGRIRFLQPDGSLKDAPLQGQMICYYGNNVERFIEVFNQFGVCLCAEK